MDATEALGICNRRRWHALACCAVVLLANLFNARHLPAGDPPLRFNRDVRPILAEQCLSCHGPDARRRASGLRLDVEASAKATLDSGLHPIVPGDITTSELIARIVNEDPDVRMPPPDSGKTLNPTEIEQLKRWISEGATWEGHWAFQPIRRPTIPVPTHADRVKNPIDAFVQQRLSEQRLDLAPPAQRATLLRRVFFDLVGLPPSASEAERFLTDDSPQAYEDAVDRLLASPHFGERLAIMWLDLVRYADSVGYFADQPVKVDPYRDYVIAAFNANMPFDQFTIEQLAGDLLPQSGERQKIAVAYNRLGRISSESGVQEKEYLSKYIAERVRNVGTTWLGLSLGCCECHDHKFDPLPARDFYRLAAFFADIKEQGVYTQDNQYGLVDFGPDLQLGTPSKEQQRAGIIAQIEEATRDIDRLRLASHNPTPEFAAEKAAWLAGLGRPVTWSSVKLQSAESTGRAHLQSRPDGSVEVRGLRPDRDTYIVRARVPAGPINAVRLEALSLESLPGNGPGRGTEGQFILTGFSLSIISKGVRTTVPFRSATATFELIDAAEDSTSKRWSAAAAIGQGPKRGLSGWAVTGRTGASHEAIFEIMTDIDLHASDELVFELEQNAGDCRSLGKFRLSVAHASRPVETFGYHLPLDIRDILTKSPAAQDKSSQQAISEYFAVNVSKAGTELVKHRQKLRHERALLNREIPSVLTVERVDPRPIRVLNRGDWQDESGELVSPGLPDFLPQPPATGRPTRLDLARSIVSPDNPLTARVLVNRLWKLYFGEAFSRQVDNFGTQGEWPTHPELLDWLAAELIESGWNLKHIIRLIVTSDAYRQSSNSSPEATERDPENRWISHQGKIRLDAELVRDAALTASGLISTQIGGGSVFPYQPDGYWDVLNKPRRAWIESRGDGVYRRGLYTHWQRQFLHPMLQAFDAPSREECTAARPRSSTPLQALVLLNDPTFVEAARALAQSSLQQGRSSDETLVLMYRRALSRSPTPAEQSVLNTLLETHLRDYRHSPESAARLLKTGRLPVSKDRPPAEIAAWTNVARVILNHHDMLLRQ